MALPEFLAVGHISKDIINGKFRLGGATAYAALTARNLGKRAAVITAVGPELELELDLDGVALHRLRSRATTTFENVYRDGQRIQYLHAVARRIGPEDIPEGWRRALLVHLGPIAQGVDEELVEAFPNALIGHTPGMDARLGREGSCLLPRMAGGQAGPVRISMVIFSEEDAPESEALARQYSIFDAH